MADAWQRVVDMYAERDQQTTEQLGCPLSLRTPDGEVSCERAVKARIAEAMWASRTAGLLKAATPLLLPARRRTAGNRVVIDLAPEEFHELRNAIDRLRGDGE